ncbi:papain-like cysteine protease family protein [Photobacterium sp. R1]
MKIFIALLLLLHTSSVVSQTNCINDINGNRQCRSELDFSNFFQAAFQNQYQSQWCWAASISMIFKYYSHPVSQERIVSEVYGSPVNMPAAYGSTISRQINKDWYDDLSVPFSSRVTGLFDLDAGVTNLTNQDIVDNLDQEKPLIIGTAGHAMVLSSVDYIVTLQGPQIIGALAFDPWPGRGLRSLSPSELTPVVLGGQLRYLASVAVTEDAPSDSPANSSGSGGGSVSYAFMILLVIVSLFRIRL